VKVYGWEGQAVEEVSIEYHWESLIIFCGLSISYWGSLCLYALRRRQWLYR